MKVLCFICIISFVFSIGSCHKNKPPKCDGSTVSWNTNIRPIITGNCTTEGCHPTFKNYVDIKYTLDNGMFRETVITRQTMPKDGKLTQADLNKLQCWVEAGYPEN